MRVIWRSLSIAVLLLGVLATTAGASDRGAQSEYYIVVSKDEQRLYLAQGNPRAPRSTDVIKSFGVTTGAVWSHKGLETPSGFFTIISKKNEPDQGSYDFYGNGDITFTPYFMRLDVPGRSGIGIHTYEGDILTIKRFGLPGGQSTHGCIAGPPEDIIDLYQNYVQPKKTKVWVVDGAHEAFGDLPGPPAASSEPVNGMEWQALRSPTKEQFYSVDMLRPDLGWALAGDTAVIKNEYKWFTKVFKWDGRGWSLQVELPYWLHSIDMLNEDEGWAVGDAFIALQYKKGKWIAHEREFMAPMNDVEVLSGDNAWMSGVGGRTLSWNGAAWAWDQYAETFKTIRSVSMLDDKDGGGWAAGGAYDLEYKLTQPWLARFDGETFRWTRSPVRKYFYGVATVSRKDAWAVGQDGAIVRWNGEKWRSFKSPTEARLNAVAMRNSRDGWIVGDEKGVALHWDGKSWSRVRLPVQEKFYAISALEDGTAMAVGSGGAIVRLAKAARKPLQQEPEKPGAPQPTPDFSTQPDNPYGNKPQPDSVSTQPAELTAVPAVLAPKGPEVETTPVTEAGAGSPPIGGSASASSGNVTQATSNEAAAPDRGVSTTSAPRSDAQRFPVAPVAAAAGGLVLAAMFFFRRQVWRFAMAAGETVLFSRRAREGLSKPSHPSPFRGQGSRGSRMRNSREQSGRRSRSGRTPRH